MGFAVVPIGFKPVFKTGVYRWIGAGFVQIVEVEYNLVFLVDIPGGSLGINSAGGQVGDLIRKVRR